MSIVIWHIFRKNPAPFIFVVARLSVCEVTGIYEVTVFLNDDLDRATSAMPLNIDHRYPSSCPVGSRTFSFASTGI